MWRVAGRSGFRKLARRQEQQASLEPRLFVPDNARCPTSDPRDVATPRGETPPDVEMRIRAIGHVRKGDDPGTKWQVQIERKICW